MPPSSRSRRPTHKTNAPTRTAEKPLVQLTWVVGDRTFSREFDAIEEREIRAARLGLYTRGARNVSTTKLAKGETYTEHGAQ